MVIARIPTGTAESSVAQLGVLVDLPADLDRRRRLALDRGDQLGVRLLGGGRDGHKPHRRIRQAAPR